MFKLNRLFNVILCGAVSVAAVSEITTHALKISPFSEISLKTAHFKTHCRYRINRTETNKEKFKAVYDLYAKVDSETFPLDETPKIYEVCSEKVIDVQCRLDKTSNSYIYADVIGFEPAQMTYNLLAFPTNGDYTCYVYTTTGIDADFVITVSSASSAYDSKDKTPPEIRITVPDASKYVKGKDIIVNIETNELCDIKVNGKTYEECNGVNAPISADGVYKVEATDINGNPATASFTVDAISKSTSTTKATTKATTTIVTTTKKPVSPTILYGDANLDGIVTMSDAAAVFQVIGNPDKYALAAEGSLSADCYDPGSGITPNDAITIQKYYSDVIQTLPQYS